MTAQFYFRQVARECRGAFGRLAYFAACLAIGVAAVTSVASLSASLDAGIRAEAREMIGADIMLESRQAIPPEVDEVVGKLDDVEISKTRRQAGVIAAVAGPQPGRSLLTEIKVIEGRFPFYGSLGLDPPLPLADLLDAESVVVAPEVMSRLGLSLGNSVRMGGWWVCAAVSSTRASRGRFPRLGRSCAPGPMTPLCWRSLPIWIGRRYAVSP